jgi:hypothetical protein
MNDPVFVCMSEAGDCLAGKIQRTCHRNTALDSICQGFIAKFHGDDEMIVYETRIQNRKNVRVLQPGGNLDFVQKATWTSCRNSSCPVWRSSFGILSATRCF